MGVTRRDVLKAGAAFSAIAACPSLPARAAFAPKPGTWRNFELITRVEIAQPEGAMQAWIPLPAFADPAWFKPGGSTWETNAATAVIARKQRPPRAPSSRASPRSRRWPWHDRFRRKSCNGVEQSCATSWGTKD